MKNEYPKINPELRPVARKAPKVTYNRTNLWFINALMRVVPLPKADRDIRIENILIPSPDARRKIRLRIYRRQSVTAPAPVLLWMHGGGYVMGKPEQNDVGCAEYVRESGITVVSVAYRYAPKYPFPAGLEDCYSALKWVAVHVQQLGVDEKRIAVGGASAGGGLAAALAQLAHDQREVGPVFQLLLYPMLDDRTALRPDLDDGSNVTWNQESNRYGWESYLGRKCGEQDLPEYAVPARRRDLSGLPPAWIGVGTVDLFHDEAVAYAQRLRECGVKCELQIVPGAFHGFDVFDPQPQVVQDFRRSQISALRRIFFE